MRIQRRLRKVIVHLTDETTIEGVFTGRNAGHYVIRGAGVLRETSEGVDTVPLAGETWIPSEKVRFLQVSD